MLLTLTWTGGFSVINKVVRSCVHHTSTVYGLSDVVIWEHRSLLFSYWNANRKKILLSQYIYRTMILMEVWKDPKRLFCELISWAIIWLPANLFLTNLCSGAQLHFDDTFHAALTSPSSPFRASDFSFYSSSITLSAFGLNLVITIDTINDSRSKLGR